MSRTSLGASVQFNVLRAACASLIVGPGALLWGIADGLSASALAERALGGLAFPFIAIPFGFVGRWGAGTLVGASQSAGRLDVSGFFGWVAIVFHMIAALMFWMSLICLMLGDPLLALLKRVAPGLVPVDRVPLWNPHLVTTVEEPENEERVADQQIARSSSAPVERAGHSKPASEDLVSFSREQAREEKSIDRLDRVASVAVDDTLDPALRDALEQANDQLDVASALLHPLTEIDERKANEIDRALELARRHLASASAINDADRNPNAAEAIRLLLATALQFEGIALALGRRKFAEGARKIEAALKEVELNADREQPHPMPQILHLLALIFWELRDRRSALRYIDRAVSACPDDQEYHRLRREIQGELDTGAEQTSSGRSDTRGALLAVGVVVALLVISAGSFAVWTGGQGPFWRAEQDNSDPNRFDVNPYSAHQPIVAREAELNIRALPFARADIPILRETIAGELLDVTGLVHRPEGDWYQIRLSNGEVGYIKATLTMPESEFLETSELEIQATERDELQVAEAESAVPPGQARADQSIPLPEMVRIPGRNFEVSRYEVTFAQWDACVTDGGCNGYRPNDQGWGRGNRPVINVSWNDTQAYVQWLSQRTGQRYRLLTEAEWEYAARAGTTTNFWWGDQDPVCDRGARNGAQSYNCQPRQTLPVGSFQPNAFGLYDVHGNVWEWVEDAAGSNRVLRGGSWGSNPEVLRSAFRFRDYPTIRDFGFGFRVARTV